MREHAPRRPGLPASIPSVQRPDPPTVGAFPAHEGSTVCGRLSDGGTAAMIGPSRPSSAPCATSASTSRPSATTCATSPTTRYAPGCAASARWSWRVRSRLHRWRRRGRRRLALRSRLSRRHGTGRLRRPRGHRRSRAWRSRERLFCALRAGEIVAEEAKDDAQERLNHRGCWVAVDRLIRDEPERHQRHEHQDPEGNVCTVQHVIVPDSLALP